MTPAELKAGHRARQAAIYVRQSTLTQVAENLESQRRQYGLVERAVELGWRRSEVLVIDDDLGVSGSGVARSGFDRLVAEVGLGHIGMIFAIEVSRLARNNRDWYHLLDLCALVDTVIGRRRRSLDALNAIRYRLPFEGMMVLSAGVAAAEGS